MNPPELNTVIHGDALETMRSWPDKAFDLIVTDPPYGVGMDVKRANAGGDKYGKAAAAAKVYHASGWDAAIPSADVFAEMRRVSRNQVIFGGNYFTAHLPPSRCWLVWDKRVLEQMSDDFADCELAWTSFDDNSRMIRFIWKGMIQNNMKDKEERYHPTQKPVRVMEMVLERFSKAGETVLDPYAGSGSTLVAAERMGLGWVGVEREANYVEVARERIKLDRVQGRLFT